MTPTEKVTAFLIIHGEGTHSPFEACDHFLRGFCDEYFNTDKSGDNGPVVKVQHLINQKGQSYLSLPVPEKGSRFDFYEYYWDRHMVHKASFYEAYDVLFKASSGACKFYKKYPDLLNRPLEPGVYTKRKLAKQTSEFRPGGYLILLSPWLASLIKMSSYVPVLRHVLDLFIKRPIILKVMDLLADTDIPILKQICKWIVNIAKGILGSSVPDFAGDLVSYLDLDTRSGRFGTRERIINGAVDDLRELLMDNRYYQIIIIGHSLGSVIAYDALNRIMLEVNLGSIDIYDFKKITGFITFGSPLDMISFFFYEYIHEQNLVQHQMLHDLHGFMTRSRDEDEYEDKRVDKTNIVVENSLHINTPRIRWLNFYHPNDVISDRLDSYKLEDQALSTFIRDGNIQINGRFSKKAVHGCYWGEHLGKNRGTNQMYEAIIGEFFSRQ